MTHIRDAMGTSFLIALLGFFESSVAAKSLGGQETFPGMQLSPNRGAGGAGRGQPGGRLLHVAAGLRRLREEQGEQGYRRQKPHELHLPQSPHPRLQSCSCSPISTTCRSVSLPPPPPNFFPILCWVIFSLSLAFRNRCSVR